MRLQHAVDGDQAVDCGLEIPDVLAEPGEVVSSRLLAGPRRPQLLQTVAEQIGGLGMVEDVVTEGRLIRELGRGVGPASDHLHQLDFEVAIVGQAPRVLLHGKASAKLASVYDRHRMPPFRSRSRGVEKSRRLLDGQTTRTTRSTISRKVVPHHPSSITLNPAARQRVSIDRAASRAAVSGSVAARSLMRRLNGSGITGPSYPTSCNARINPTRSMTPVSIGSARTVSICSSRVIPAGASLT